MDSYADAMPNNQNIEADWPCQSAIDALSAHLCILDEHATIILVNQAWIRFALDNGYRHQRFGIGINYLNVCESVRGSAAENARAVARGIQDVMSGKRDIFRLEYPCHSPTEKRWFLITVTRFENHDPLRIIVSHENITVVKQTQAAISLSEQRFKSVIDNSPFALNLKDKQGRYLLANKQFEQWWDIDVEKIKDKTPYDLFPKNLAEALCLWDQEVLETGKVLVQTTQASFCDDSLHDLEITKFPIIDMDGRINGLGSIHVDITERKRLEQQTQWQYVKLIQTNKMATLGTVAASIAHEINNPNNVVLLNADLLSQIFTDLLSVIDTIYSENKTLSLIGLPYSELRQEVPTLLDDVRQAAFRVQKIVDNLKHFSRPQNHDNRSAYFDPNEAVRRSVALLNHVIVRKTQHFRLDLAKRISPVAGDSLKLEQVITNLLMNALQALPDSSRGVTVSTRMEPVENWVELVVSDQGIGIPGDLLHSVFDPFFTTKADSGGCGLGLSIVHSLIDDLGGRILLESDPNRGTEVYVRLPPAVDAYPGDE